MLGLSFKRSAFQELRVLQQHQLNHAAKISIFSCPWWMQLDFRSIKKAARDHFIQHWLFSWPSYKFSSSSSTTVCCRNVNSYLIRLNLLNFNKTYFFSCCSFLATKLTLFCGIWSSFPNILRQNIIVYINLTRKHHITI